MNYALLLKNFSSSDPDQTAGSQFFANTTGLRVTSVSFDIAGDANTPFNYALRYTTDHGSTWTTVSNSLGSTPAGNTTVGQVPNGFNFPTPAANDPVTFNLSSLNIPQSSGFGIEIVSAETAGSYLLIPNGFGSPPINPLGNWYVDMVTITATTPEPGSLVLAGLIGVTSIGSIGWRRLRKNQAASLERLPA